MCVIDGKSQRKLPHIWGQTSHAMKTNGAETQRTETKEDGKPGHTTEGAERMSHNKGEGLNWKDTSTRSPGKLKATDVSDLGK